ncbi:MAG: hypothetical protein Q8N88_06250 [Nanoarchaeota archaeon]|nr:hypothetical protein [Nanoarchaeota archaeon]
MIIGDEDFRRELGKSIEKIRNGKQINYWSVSVFSYLFESVALIPRYVSFAVSYWTSRFGDDLVTNLGGLEEEDLEEKGLE